MIDGKLKYKAPRLTVDQKALKKALKVVAKDIKAKVRGKVPRKTGALKAAVHFIVKSKNGRAYSVIGVKSKYTRKGKVPNKYALKQGMKQLLQQYVNSTTAKDLAREVQNQKDLITNAL